MVKWFSGESIFWGTNGYNVKSWYGMIIWICNYGLVMKFCNDFLFFPNVEVVLWWINIFGKSDERDQSWYGEMLIWLYDLNMPVWFCGEMVQFFVLFSRGWNCAMVNQFFCHIIIDWYMVNWCSANMVKWWRKKWMVKWTVWWYLNVSWVISSSLVSLNFIQYTNDGNTYNYREARIYYLWLPLVSLIFYLFTFLYSLLVKWCDGEIIPNVAVMMVRRFCSGYLMIGNVSIDYCRSEFFSVHIPGCISWVSFPVHVVTQYNFCCANCPRRCPGIR